MATLTATVVSQLVTFEAFGITWRIGISTEASGAFVACVVAIRASWNEEGLRLSISIEGKDAPLAQWPV